MSAERSPATRFDVIVVGGGQAGLATGYYLARLGLHFVILDAGERIGDAWRRRWDSLRLFTPARLNGLPGMPFPADAISTVTKDAMADYLEGYATRFGLPVRLRTAVEAIEVEGGRFVVDAGASRFQSEHVVVATGGHPTPFRPAFAGDLAPGIVQLHSCDYRNPSQLREGRVLVIGAGNSGAEIALELAGSHETWLAGRATGRFSSGLYARPSWWLLKRITDVRTPVGKMIRKRALESGTPRVRLGDEDLEAAGVVRAGRVVAVEGGRPQLDDGRVLEVENVVWCTGFSHDFSWIKAVGEPGLFFVGLPFQSNLASALVDGVGGDARSVSARIASAIRKRTGGTRDVGGDKSLQEVTSMWSGGSSDVA